MEKQIIFKIQGTEISNHSLNEIKDFNFHPPATGDFVKIQKDENSYQVLCVTHEFDLDEYDPKQTITIDLNILQ